MTNDEGPWIVYYDPETGTTKREKPMTSPKWEKEFGERFKFASEVSFEIKDNGKIIDELDIIKDFIRKTREEAVEEYKAALVERVKVMKKDFAPIDPSWHLTYNQALDDILNIINEE